MSNVVAKGEIRLGGSVGFRREYERFRLMRGAERKMFDNLICRSGTLPKKRLNIVSERGGIRGTK